MPFADMVRERTWSEQSPPTEGEHAVWPGLFNLAGEFFDLEGEPLRISSGDVSSRQAKKCVLRGALVALEGCGCGGAYGDCGPRWMSIDLVEKLKMAPPPLLVPSEVPTWIDVWKGGHTTVVFCHGTIEWVGLTCRKSGPTTDGWTSERVAPVSRRTSILRG